MNVADTIRASLWNYPSLHKTRTDVLHHLFLVIGNGYAWRNGEIVSRQPRDDARSDREVFHDEEAEAAIFDTRIMPPDPSAGQDAEARRLERRADWIGRYLDENAQMRAVRARIDALVADDRIEFTRKLYPLSEYSLLTKVPDDVRPDWLDTARGTIMAIYQHMVDHGGSYSAKDAKNTIQWADKALKSIHKRFGKWYDEEPGSFAEYQASIPDAHADARKEAPSHAHRPPEAVERHVAAPAATAAALKPNAPSLDPRGYLAKLLAITPLERRNERELGELLESANLELESAKLFGNTVRHTDAETMIGMIQTEVARRQKLAAEAPSFQVGDTVQIVRELADWNMASSAKPRVGMTGTVVALDSYDAKHLPAGKTPVRLSMADLGYEVDPDDEDSLYHTFYIHSWALRHFDPANTARATAQPTADTQTAPPTPGRATKRPTSDTPISIIGVRYDLEYFDDWDMLLLDPDLAVRATTGEDLVTVAQEQIDRQHVPQMPRRRITKAVTPDELDPMFEREPPSSGPRF